MRGQRFLAPLLGVIVALVALSGVAGTASAAPPPHLSNLGVAGPVLFCQAHGFLSYQIINNNTSVICTQPATPGQLPIAVDETAACLLVYPTTITAYHQPNTPADVWDCYGIPANAPPPGCNPYINHVSEIAARGVQQITITGGCFGRHAPYNGDSAFLLIADATAHWNAGCDGQSNPYCQGNTVHLNVRHWSNSRIVVDGFTGAYGSGIYVLHAGDRMAVSVWNPQNNAGILYPNDQSLIPPVPSYTLTVGGGCSPTVADVSRVSTAQTQTIAISGSCFGSHAPFSNGNTLFLEIHDASQGDWGAGYGGDIVSLSVSSWTNNRIVVTGFAGAFGTSGFTLNRGDQVLISVSNASSADPQHPDGPSTFAKTVQ